MADGAKFLSMFLNKLFKIYLDDQGFLPFFGLCYILRLLVWSIQPTNVPTHYLVTWHGKNVVEKQSKLFFAKYWEGPSTSKRLVCNVYIKSREFLRRGILFFLTA